MSSAASLPPLYVRALGVQPYDTTFAAMKAFTDNRTPDTPDEIWWLQHTPVFTQGQAGNAEHIIDVGDIPLVQSDRGGHVTYHGPGQITCYVLLDLKRIKVAGKSIGVRDLVDILESAMLTTLQHWCVKGHTRKDAPGVYIRRDVHNPEDNMATMAKIGSLGLRVRRGCSYHGLNFNVDMDLSPWSRINPCGLSVPMTQLVDEVAENIVDVPPVSIPAAAKVLVAAIVDQLGYNSVETVDGIGE